MIDSFDTLGLPLTFRFGSIAAKTGAMISHWSLVKSILQFRYQETELKAREIHYPHGFGLLSTFEIRSNYFWNFGDTTSIDDTSILRNTNYTYIKTGIYHPIIIGSFKGCKDTFRLQLVDARINSTTSPYNEKLDNIYPNPFNDFIIINKVSLTNATIYIYDQSGRIVKYLVMAEDKKPYTINTQDIVPGVYYLRLVDQKSKTISFNILIKNGE